MLAPLPLLGEKERRKSPQLHFLPKFSLLAQSEKERDTPLIYFLLFPSYTI
jgi:hypothetical protein